MMQPQKHPILIRLAHALLAKAERSQGDKAVSLRLDDIRILPELIQAASPDELAPLVLLLGELCASTWVRLQTRKAQPFQTLADQQPALLLLDAPALAEWSGFTPSPPRWSRLLVDALRTPGVLQVPDAASLLDYLLRSPLPWFEHRSPSECAHTLNELARTCGDGSSHGMYLRELSARHFNGHSKVLDAREELLRLLGATVNQFLETPVQLLIDLPSAVDGAQMPFNEVIFIENLVSFERMAQSRRPSWARSALIFASGFKGTARRLRQRQGTSLYWRDAVPREQRDAFERWLYGECSEVLPRLEPSCCFFGDLDYAGMQILGQLRHSFADCRAWSPGYLVLLDQLRAARGHTPIEAKKEGQIDPGFTGCPFADETLLPALRIWNRCVDQEAWG